MPARHRTSWNPLWFQVAALLPTRQVYHALGCLCPRIPDQLIFDKLVQVLVFGASADEWAGVNAGGRRALGVRPGEQD